MLFSYIYSLIEQILNRDENDYCFKLNAIHTCDRVHQIKQINYMESDHLIRIRCFCWHVYMVYIFKIISIQYTINCFFELYFQAKFTIDHMRYKYYTFGKINKNQIYRKINITYLLLTTKRTDGQRKKKHICLVSFKDMSRRHFTFLQVFIYYYYYYNTHMTCVQQDLLNL